MNKTKISWTEYSWNPVTGCLHDCPYCYAQRIARRFDGKADRSQYMQLQGKPDIFELGEPKRDRFGHKMPYPMGFDPTFHTYHLSEPQRMIKPSTIFVCSMADLFGHWVPDRWIEEVFKACKAAPQHRYLFLTKNPQRYNDLDAQGKLPNDENFWYGVTRTGKDSDREHEAAMTANTFLSVEPIMAPMERQTLHAIELWKWVIIGAETGNRKGKIMPDKAWVMEIADACAATGTSVFMKESIQELMGDDFRQEFPWEEKA